MSAENNTRIAKNTMLLYFRMLLTMAVSLYTVRIVLNTLGAVDYGIHNVVGGIVVMFSFLSNTMSSASQRFFAFELGRGDQIQLKRTFSMTMTIYIIIAIVIVVLAESIGLWFLYNKMVIPPERMVAAQWVYQFSIFSFIVTILAVPYNAAIIAHENMKVYAYVSIIEVSLKLLIAYLLVLVSSDKLKLYAVLLFLTTCIISTTYHLISKRKYKECIYRFYWDRNLFKILVGYSGWNMFGALASILNKQGINILLNIFFGPVVNASRAIAYQVSSAVNQFVMNFFKAVQPQITKYYSSGENNKMMQLVFRSSKFSYFLLFILSMPVLIETSYILTLWLKEVPDYVLLFTRIILVTSLIDAISYPLQTAAQATGNIKSYQAIVGGMMLLNLPVSFVFLKFGFGPEITMIIALIISVICLLLRLLILSSLIGLSLKKFYNKVLILIAITTIVAYIVPLIISYNLPEGVIRFIIVGGVGIFNSAIAIFIFGLEKSERQFIVQSVKSRFLTK